MSKMMAWIMIGSRFLIMLLPIATQSVTIGIVIKSFLHKGLEKFYSTGSLAGIQPMHAKHLRLILAQLNQARTIYENYH